VVTQVVQELADRYWDGLLAADPLLGLQCGDDRYSHRLPDLSPSGWEAREHLSRGALAEVAVLRRGDSGLDDLAVLDTVECIAKAQIAAIDLGVHRWSSIDHMWGPATVPDQMGSLQVAETPRQFENYFLRLTYLPQYLAQCSALLRSDSSRPGGPGLVVDRCIAQVQRILDCPPESSPFLKPIHTKQIRRRSMVTQLLMQALKPAFGQYQDALKSYRSKARSSIGLCGLTDGDAIYAFRIKQWTSLPLTPHGIRELGAEELGRTYADMDELASHLGAANAAEAMQAYGADSRNYFLSRDDIVRAASEQVERAWVRLPEFFRRLPSASCVVRPVDPSREADVLEHYFPAADGRPAIYFVNTASPERKRRNSLPVVTYHEANPGHHLQISREREQARRPDLLRLGGELAASAFIEGWGLYAERLADEMELYVDDFERLAMLGSQAFREARLVVDTGIHAFGWSIEKATEELVRTGLDEKSAALEAARYVALPGQALAYKIGQVEINRTRHQMATSADRSAVQDFHEWILGLGAVPLSTLRRAVTAKTSESKQAG